MKEIFAENKISNLSDLGNIVPEGYQYFNKKVSSGLTLNLPGASFKWYNLHLSGKEISKEQILEAREFVKFQIKNGTLKLNGELGFVILHRAGDYFLLLVTTWRNTNEMWESVYLKRIDKEEEYTPLEFEYNHRGTYCVWELGIVWHERNAWVKFIKSNRDDEAKEDYLIDTFSGEV